MVAPSPRVMSDILTRDDINVTLVDEALWVGSISAAEVPASAWPLLKCMFSETSRRDGDDRPGFFSLTQEEDGLTLIMDDRCQRVFAEAAEAGVANVTYAPHRWRAFEVHLGQLVFEVPRRHCWLSLCADPRMWAGKAAHAAPRHRSAIWTSARAAGAPHSSPYPLGAGARSGLFLVDSDGRVPHLDPEPVDARPRLCAGGGEGCDPRHGAYSRQVSPPAAPRPLLLPELMHVAPAGRGSPQAACGPPPTHPQPSLRRAVLTCLARAAAPRVRRLGGDVDELKAAISDEVQRHQGGRPAGDGRSPPSRGIGAAAELVPAVRASQGADAPGSAGAEGSAVGGLGAGLASVGIGEPSGAAAGDAAGGDAASMAERGAAGRTAAEGDAGRPASVARSGVDWRSERLNDEAGCGVSSEAQPPEWYIKVLAPRLVLIRLQLQMMEPSTHALMKRLLFSPRRAAASFWAYTFTEDDVSLIIDEVNRRNQTLGGDPRTRVGSSLPSMEAANTCTRGGGGGAAGHAAPKA